MSLHNHAPRDNIGKAIKIPRLRFCIFSGCHMAYQAHHNYHFEKHKYFKISLILDSKI